MCDESGWYTSTTELQLASLQFCRACRSVTTLTLIVDDKTPRRLLDGVDPPPLDRKRARSSRAPELRALHVKWNLPTAADLRTPIYAVADAIEIVFGNVFDGSLDGIAWPDRLKALEFSPDSRFNNSIAGFAWPRFLHRITFGRSFNKSVDGVLLPASIRQITFGNGFNQPIEQIQWPKGLCLLTFGRDFNQPIEGVAWPESLKVLTFGEYFDQPIELVKWPDSVTSLLFGDYFNQPIERATWPVALEELSFGFVDHNLSTGDRFSMWSRFSKALDTSSWPTSLRKLSIGGEFLKSLEGLGTWMPNLQEFTLLVREWCPYGSFLRPIEWPKGLRELTVHNDVDPGQMSIPDTVKILCLLRDKW